jgi:hypothetical protein
LERRLVVLATVAQITPLLGFLGTVMGMIQMFKVIQEAQPGPGQLARRRMGSVADYGGRFGGGGAGVCCLQLSCQPRQNIVLEMERAASEFISFLAP